MSSLTLRLDEDPREKPTLSRLHLGWSLSPSASEVVCSLHGWDDEGKLPPRHQRQGTGRGQSLQSR